MLRDWREDRRRSQLDLALDVGVSTRHLSFVETGKAKPSPELVLALAEHLDVPLRERNTMLLAAGYAPRYQQTPLDDDALASVRQALVRADPRPRPVPGRGRRPRLGRGHGEHRRPGVARRCRRPPRSSRRSTSIGSRCTRTGWRRGSRTSPSGRTTSSARSTGRSRSPATPACGDLLDEVSAYPNIRRPRGGVADPLGVADGRRAPAPAGRRRRRHGAVVVLDQHLDRHARRHHPRGAPRRAVPPRRRGDGGAGRRPSLRCRDAPRTAYGR